MRRKIPDNLLSDIGETVVITRATHGADTLRALHWLANAASTDMTRTVLQSILIEDGNAIATDGRRLHRCPAPENFTESGVWFITEHLKSRIELRKLNNHSYLNYKQVIPSNYADCPAMKHERISLFAGWQGVGQFLHGCPVALNPVYVLDALFGDREEKRVVYCHSENHNGPIVIQREKTPDWIAVMMPLRDSEWVPWVGLKAA